MLSRSVEKTIQAWAKEGKKPLLITGARQVGKTFMVREGLKGFFKKIHVFNFEKTKSLNRIFDGDLNPLV